MIQVWSVDDGVLLSSLDIGESVSETSVLLCPTSFHLFQLCLTLFVHICIFFFIIIEKMLHNVPFCQLCDIFQSNVM